MNKEQFIKLEEILKNEGYKKYNETWHHEDYVYYKGFHKEDNKWEENRSAYQIGLSIYDYSIRSEYWDRIPKGMRDHVGIEIRIDVSRTVNERIDMCMAWHEDTKIDDIEIVAESFYKWVCETYQEPIE